MPTTRKEKTAEEIARDLALDQQAQAAGKIDPPRDLESPDPDDKTLLIHITAELAYVNGVRFGRGAELEFAIPGQAFFDTFDRKGRSWLVNEQATVHRTYDPASGRTLITSIDYPDNPTLRDAMSQAEQWGEVRFAEGPWRGKGWDNDIAARAERERNRAAPILDAKV